MAFCNMFPVYKGDNEPTKLVATFKIAARVRSRTHTKLVATFKIAASIRSRTHTKFVATFKIAARVRSRTHTHMYACTHTYRHRGSITQDIVSNAHFGVFRPRSESCSQSVLTSHLCLTHLQLTWVCSDHAQ